MELNVSRRKFITAAASVIPPAIAYAHPKSGGLLSFLANEPEPTKAEKTDWKNAGVIDLSNSPYAKLKTVPIRAVVIQHGFWSQRRKTNLVASIPSMHDELLEHGRMDNFLRLEGKSSEPQKGPVYSDSDIYKWAELEDPECTLERPDCAPVVCEWRRGSACRGRGLWRSVRTPECTCVWRELRGDREHDVELAHAGGVGRREVHRRD
jgi:hypothetical protein